MKKVFLDTNVVVDLLAKRENFYEDATRIFSLAYNKKIVIVVSPMTYATVSYLLRKNQNFRQLLYNFRQLTDVSLADEKVVDAALTSAFDDFEDAMQYHSALTSNVEMIITRNVKDFTISQIPVLIPHEFLQSVRA